MPKNNGANVTVALKQLNNFVVALADYSVENDDCVIKASSATITLESAANAGAGRVYHVLGVDTAAITNDYTGTALYTCTSANTLASFISDGTNWIQIAPAVRS